MNNIEKKLIELGVTLPKQKISAPQSLPSEVADLVMNYQHSVLFDNEIIFNPQYITGLEGTLGELSLDVLWGLEDGKFNIFKANKSLNHLEADNTLFSIGSSIGGNHICLSIRNKCIYLFVNDSDNEYYKIFDTITLFIDSLKINVVTSNKNNHAKSVKLNF